MCKAIAPLKDVHTITDEDMNGRKNTKKREVAKVTKRKTEKRKRVLERKCSVYKV